MEGKRAQGAAKNCDQTCKWEPDELISSDFIALQAYLTLFSKQHFQSACTGVKRYV